MSKTNTYKDRKEKWASLRKKLDLKIDNKALWIDAFDILNERFKDRYFDPAFRLLTYGYNSNDTNFIDSQKGSGFAVITILASTIEIFNTLFTGRVNKGFNNQLKNFLKRNNIQKFEIGRSNQENFQSFFNSVDIFKSNSFFKDNFYQKYRNSLFHSGMTDNRFNVNIFIKEIDGNKKAKAIEFIYKNNNEIKEVEYAFPLCLKDKNIILIYRESFYFHLKNTVMLQIHDAVKNNEHIISNNEEKPNIRFSLARLLDIIYSEGDFQNYEEKKWWNDESISKNIELSNYQKLKNNIKTILTKFKC